MICLSLRDYNETPVACLRIHSLSTS